MIITYSTYFRFSFFLKDFCFLNDIIKQNSTTLLSFFFSYSNFFFDQSLSFYFNNFLILLHNRYKKTKRKYPLVGLPGKMTFYYWASFSYHKIKGFRILRNKFFGFKFTQFYFTPSILLLKQQKYKTYLISLRKKISFFKKTNTIDKSTLFRVGSYSWKRIIFRRSLWKMINNIKTKNQLKKPIKKTSFLNKTRLNKSNSYTLVKKSKLVNKKIKAPLNTKKKFNRLFFTNRKIFESLMGFRSLRQLRFTRYFSNFFKKNFLSIIYSLEFNITNILIKSRFTFTKQGAISLLKNNFVFLNGFCINSEHVTLKVSDRLQLIISKSFYYYYRRYLSNLQALKKKTGYRVWLLTRFMFNFFKQSMKNVPKWVYKLSHYKLDVPKFLEVDYSILCSIVVYYPNPLFEMNFYNMKYINLALLRLYNWKYIT